MTPEQKMKIYNFWHDRESRVKDLVAWPVKIVASAERHVGELFCALAVEEKKVANLAADNHRLSDLVAQQHQQIAELHAGRDSLLTFYQGQEAESKREIEQLKGELHSTRFPRCHDVDEFYRDEPEEK